MFTQFLPCVFALAPLTTVLAEAPPHMEQPAQMHRQIDADQLKSWYDQKKPMTVLDARSKPYFDGTLLPHAKWVPADSSEEKIKAAIPSKNSLVVVYCANTQCPASGWLYDKLTEMGYTNVYEYHGGIQEWKSKGFPTTHQKN